MFRNPYRIWRKHNTTKEEKEKIKKEAQLAILEEELGILK